MIFSGWGSAWQCSLWVCTNCAGSSVTGQRWCCTFLACGPCSHHLLLQAGEYDVSLLVGDPSAANGINWAMGSVELLQSGPDSEPVLRTASHQPLNNIKPVIQHMFVSEGGGLLWARHSMGALHAKWHVQEEAVADSACCACLVILHTHLHFLTCCWHVASLCRGRLTSGPRPSCPWCSRP